MGLDASQDLSGFANRLAALETTLPNLATNSALASVQSAIPSAASVMPPSVGVAGAKGNNTTAFALADHTHATSVQRTTIASASAGLVTWVFNRPYDTAGKLPVCTACPELPSGSTNFYVVNVVAGSVTYTQVQFQIVKYSTQTLSGLLTGILGSIINLFAPASSGVTLHCQAALPTQ